MILRRRGTGYERDRSDFKCYGTGSATLTYLAFGDGSERTPDFDVTISWLDVEMLIGTFVTVGQPEAVRLKKALALASAVEEMTKI